MFFLDWLNLKFRRRASEGSLDVKSIGICQLGHRFCTGNQLATVNEPQLTGDWSAPLACVQSKYILEDMLYCGSVDVLLSTRQYMTTSGIVKHSIFLYSHCHLFWLQYLSFVASTELLFSPYIGSV